MDLRQAKRRKFEAEGAKPVEYLFCLMTDRFRDLEDSQADRCGVWWWCLTIYVGTEDDHGRVKIDMIGRREDIAVNVVAELLGEVKKTKRKIVCGIHID